MMLRWQVLLLALVLLLCLTCGVNSFKANGEASTDDLWRSFNGRSNAFNPNSGAFNPTSHGSGKGSAPSGSSARSSHNAASRAHSVLQNAFEYSTGQKTAAEAASGVLKTEFLGYVTALTPYFDASLYLYNIYSMVQEHGGEFALFTVAGHTGVYYLCPIVVGPVAGPLGASGCRIVGSMALNKALCELKNRKTGNFTADCGLHFLDGFGDLLTKAGFRPYMQAAGEMIIDGMDMANGWVMEGMEKMDGYISEELKEYLAEGIERAKELKEEGWHLIRVSGLDKYVSNRMEEAEQFINAQKTAAKAYVSGKMKELKVDQYMAQGMEKIKGLKVDEYVTEGMEKLVSFNDAYVKPRVEKMKEIKIDEYLAGGARRFKEFKARGQGKMKELKVDEYLSAGVEKIKQTGNFFQQLWK